MSLFSIFTTLGTSDSHFLACWGAVKFLGLKGCCEPQKVEKHWFTVLVLYIRGNKLSRNKSETYLKQNVPWI